MSQPEMRPPIEVSRSILQAIQGALAEEKRPRSTRFLKIATFTLLCTLILTAPIALLFREQMNWAWKLAALIWGLCFLGGFSLYFYPQPRLSVPGYWSPWIFAKVLIGMTILTGAQILLCPSFVFLDSPLSWSPFLPITEWFMAMGGMKACMFSCGFIFAGLGGTFVFLSIRKVLSRSSRLDLLRAVGIAYVTQIPLIGVQIADDNLRAFVLYWAIGGAAGLIGVALLISLFARTKPLGGLK